MSHTTHTIGAGEFKAKCLQLMNEVHDKHATITITKRGVPIAKLVPIEEKPLDLFGCMQGSVYIAGDIIVPIEIKWEVNE